MIRVLIIATLAAASVSESEVLNDTSRIADMRIFVKVLPGKPVTIVNDERFGRKAKSIEFILETLPKALMSIVCKINLPCDEDSGMEIYGKEGYLEFTECSNGDGPEMTDEYQEYDRMMLVPYSYDAKDPSFKCHAEVVSGPRPVPITTAAPVRPIQPSHGCKCGQSFYPRVVNGQYANPGEIPWQISFQRILRPGMSGSICGATLLNADWVLTAAHCLIDIRMIVLLLGTLDVTQGGLMIRPSKVIGHPYYQKGPKFNDIAVLQLSSSVQFSKMIYPACLPRYMKQETFAGAPLQISGWGAIREGGRPSNLLLKAMVTGISNDQCKKTYGPKTIGNGMLCAANPGIDTCQGDSGGPLTFKAGNGLHYVVGVVSWGNGCARRSYPGIYARVTTYMDWIDYVTNYEICSL